MLGKLVARIHRASVPQPALFLLFQKQSTSSRYLDARKTKFENEKTSRVHEDHLATRETALDNFIEKLETFQGQLSVSEWDTFLKQSIGLRYTKITVDENNFPGIAMRLCLKTANYPAAKSLVTFVEQLDSSVPSPPPRIGLYSTFMRVCGLTSGYDVERDVSQALSKIPEAAFSMDSSVTLGVVTGLVNTSRWKEAARYCDLFASEDRNSFSLAHSLIAKRAFDEGEVEEGWSHLDTYDSLWAPVHTLSPAVLSYIEQCKRARGKGRTASSTSTKQVSFGRNNKSMDMVRRLLRWLSSKELPATENVGEGLVSWFQTDPFASWSVEESQVNSV
jgi:hypothetical protein